MGAGREGVPLRDGERTLAQLFDGRSELLVYHFTFGHTYSTTAGGLEFLMGYYGILDRRDATRATHRSSGSTGTTSTSVVREYLSRSGVLVS